MHSRIPFPPSSGFRGLVAASLALALATGCADPAVQETPKAEPEVQRPSKQYEIAELLNSVSFAGASFSPDLSKVLVSSDMSGIFNLYAIPIEGGEPQALTASTDESLFSRGYFPNDERLLYSADSGGNELHHIYVRELDGTTRDLTPGEARATFQGWLNDETSFLISTNERDKRFMDVYEYQADTYERQMIYRNEDGYFFGDLSPDRRYVLLSKTVSNADSDLYLHDRESGDTTLLTPGDEEVSNVAMGFDPSGDSFYFTTDQDSEFRYLVKQDLSTGERQTLVKTDWDVLFGGPSRNGNYLTAAINNDSRTEIRLYDAATMEQLELPKLPNAEISGLGVSRDETTMAFYASTSRSPSDLYVHRIGADESPRRLTRSLAADIDEEDLVEAEVVRFESFDGLEVPGVLYRPHQSNVAGAKLPALVWVHGGPGGQSRVGFSALTQYLVNHGYVVFAINNRGSSGYGKTFFHLDDRDHGKGDLKDCIASKQMLIDTGYVDPDRIGIIGGSYGGFMVLAALTFAPEEFDIGINIFGVSNWLRTTKNIPPWWEAQRKALEKELGPFDDEEYLRSISPLFHAENIVRPLMVLQGANDPRVLREESDDIVAAAKANGVPVEYIVFEDEGHGFQKKKNRERGYAAILDFANKHLVKEPAPEPDAAG